jgi:2-polyprenyl-3-methyl-5-hydroxy-6-metoxy-1,4-benzoquinol methylase
MTGRDEMASTDDPAYTERLLAGEGAAWKRWLDVRAPYRRHLRRLDLGRTLDLGCGIGRNLVDLPRSSVGVDHNAASVEVARTRGCTAVTPDEFFAADQGPFDSLLAAHVLEHMAAADNVPLLRRYLPSIRPGGRVVLITPQEAGFASDPTHVEFVDSAALRRVTDELDLVAERSYSFPFPRWTGRWFRYNEFVAIAVVPEGNGR